MSSLVATPTTPPDLSATAKPQQDPQQLRDQLKRLFDQPDLLPDKLLGFLVDYLSVNQPMIPISNIFGFQRFTANYDTILTSETTASAVYVDIATVGPTLSDLPDGNYLVMHGGQFKVSTSGPAGFQSISVQGAAASDDDSAVSCTDQDFTSVIAVTLKSLTAQPNTIQTKYRVTGGTGTFRNRWLIALRISNL